MPRHKELRAALGVACGVTMTIEDEQTAGMEPAEDDDDLWLGDQGLNIQFANSVVLHGTEANDEFILSFGLRRPLLGTDLEQTHVLGRFALTPRRLQTVYRLIKPYCDSDDDHGEHMPKENGES